MRRVERDRSRYLGGPVEKANANGSAGSFPRPALPHRRDMSRLVTDVGYFELDVLEAA